MDLPTADELKEGLSRSSHRFLERRNASLSCFDLKLKVARAISGADAQEDVILLALGLQLLALSWRGVRTMIPPKE